MTASTLTFGDSIAMAANSLTLNVSGSGTTVGGAISGSGTLTKLGDGTAALNGANAYTGATNVSTGTLLIEGSTASGSAVTVAGGATLGGTGTVNGTVNASGTVAPGISPGILSTGSVTFSDSSSFTVEIGGTTAGNGTGFHDQIDVTGTVTIGANVALNMSAHGGFTPSTGDSFTIINNDNADAVTGTFNGLPEGATISNFLGSGLDAIISYQGGDGNDVVINVPTPEIDVQRPAGAVNSIADGGTDAQGAKKSGEQVTLTYTVENTGPGTLNVTNITSTAESNVTVDNINPTSLWVASGGGTETFDVSYTPSAGDGAFSFQLDITNNDASPEDNYDILVSGTRDGDPPGITSFAMQTPATSPTNADDLTFRVTFDEDVQNVDAGDFSVTGTTATVTNVAVFTADTVFDVTVSGGDLAGLNGTVGLDLATGQDITDSVGNALPAGEPGTDETYELDNAAPTVTINQADGQSDPTDNSPVFFTAVFNEPINAATFTNADVTIGGTATTGAVTVTEILPNDGTTFSVSVEVTSDGIVVANISAGGVEDLAGNTNEVLESTDNTVTYDGLPDVTTEPVTDERSHSATGNGTITDLGVSDPAAHGVVWNLAGGPDPTLADNSTDEGPVGPVTVPFAFTSNMTGLTRNTTYAVRAYATNDAGTTYGDVVAFTTLPGALAPAYYLLDYPEPLPRRR